jgi:hypothetical protein
MRGQSVRSGVRDMGKRTIRNWWIAGFVIELIALGGSLVVPVATRPGNFLHGHLGASVAILILSGVVALAGVVVQVVAWIEALANTRRLEDKTWHDRLFRWGIVGGLATPLLGIGVFICYGVMLSYLRNGPDGTVVPEEVGATRAPLPRTLAPTG